MFFLKSLIFQPWGLAPPPFGHPWFYSIVNLGGYLGFYQFLGMHTADFKYYFLCGCFLISYTVRRDYRRKLTFHFSAVQGSCRFWRKKRGWSTPKMCLQGWVGNLGTKRPLHMPFSRVYDRENFRIFITSKLGVVYIVFKPGKLGWGGAAWPIWNCVCNRPYAYEVTEQSVPSNGGKCVSLQPTPTN